MCPQPRRVRLSAALFAACMIGGAAAAQAAPKTLQWKFAHGAKSYYRVVQLTEATTDNGKQQSTLRNEVTTDLSWIVNTVDERGGAELTQAIERLRFKSSGGPGGDVSYDSAAPVQAEGPSAFLASYFETLVKEPMKLKMDRTGKINDIVLSEKLREQFRVFASTRFAGMFSKEGVKQMMGSGLLQFPRDPVEKGRSWEARTAADYPGGGKQTNTATYTYLGSETRNGRELEKIGLEVKVEVGGPEDAEAKFTIEEQESSGMIYFDSKTSRLVDLKLDGTMKTKLTAGSATILQTIKNSMTMQAASPESATRSKAVESANKTVSEKK
ncbi:MAG TPA: DUF6263 family protein [Pirellulales bacterium]|nr:DUF6263 family protein [Pirellulales bacterium]